MLQRLCKSPPPSSSSSSSPPFHLPNQSLPPSSPSHFQPPLTSPSSPTNLKHQCRFKLSRRELAICANSSSLLLLLGSQALMIPPISKSEEILTIEDSAQTDQPQEISPSTTEESETLAVTETPETESDQSQQDSSSSAEESLSTVADSTAESDEPQENSPANNASTSCTERKPTKRVFLDISIDGEPIGRITLGLYGDDVPTGVDRFSRIVSGASGISYRRKEFIKIMPNYVQHGGLRSYGVDAELAKGTGSSLGNESLVEEWERTYNRCPGTKNLAGSVGIIVRDPAKPPPKLKLVARKGKLEIDQEEVGTEPNGTEFVIATKDSPELDVSALVIGRVEGGMEVVQRIGQVKTVQENTGSPYFRVAKLIGDKRAVVAERGFNRPYSKVVVTNCGVLK